jgi:hypothetical protein
MATLKLHSFTSDEVFNRLWCVIDREEKNGKWDMASKREIFVLENKRIKLHKQRRHLRTVPAC